MLLQRSVVTSAPSTKNKGFKFPRVIIDAKGTADALVPSRVTIKPNQEVQLQGVLVYTGALDVHVSNQSGNFEMHLLLGPWASLKCHWDSLNFIRRDCPAP